MSLNYQQHLITEQEYLAGELVSTVRHEYINGAVYAMAGANKNHERVVTNLIRHLSNHLQDSGCEVFASDIKVKVENNFFYPDVIVVCDDQSVDEYYVEAPLLIVEVLSKSTRRTDQTLKRRAYQQLLSLAEYVLIEQDFVDIEVCRRSNAWCSEHYYLGDEVHFAAIDLSLAVETIYARVVNTDMQIFLGKV